MSIIAIDVIASRKSRMQKFELVPPQKKRGRESEWVQRENEVG